ncbi:hypothetical protein GGR51DRAFT_398777 [Nemania sp. FL0031]|nr:hypothetical protein GGR51DRAFT_398777 [Nemania sp. FL0031]
MYCTCSTWMHASLVLTAFARPCLHTLHSQPFSARQALVDLLYTTYTPSTIFSRRMSGYYVLNVENIIVLYVRMYSTASTYLFTPTYVHMCSALSGQQLAHTLVHVLHSPTLQYNTAGVLNGRHQMGTYSIVHTSIPIYWHLIRSLWWCKDLTHPHSHTSPSPPPIARTAVKPRR